MTPPGPALALGQVGERLAARHYEALGGRVLERNYRTATGELDLIVALDGCTRFVEVKTRTSGGMHPFDAITHAKQTRLRALAARWLSENPGPAREVRFDVLGIRMTRAGELLSLEQCEIVM